MTYSAFGRKLENWEIYPNQFIERGDWPSDSLMVKSILDLSREEFDQLVKLCDPGEDYLIHVDSGGCSINHGNVGANGISYEWI